MFSGIRQPLVVVGVVVVVAAPLVANRNHIHHDASIVFVAIGAGAGCHYEQHCDGFIWFALLFRCFAAPVVADDGAMSLLQAHAVVPHGQ